MNYSTEQSQFSGSRFFAFPLVRADRLQSKSFLCWVQNSVRLLIPEFTRVNQAYCLLTIFFVYSFLLLCVLRTYFNLS